MVRIRRNLLGAGMLVCAVLTSPVLAQNVTDYPSIPDPLLLLLREPAVLADLQLTAQQRKAVEEANEALDGPLLASRNRPQQQQSEQLTKWLAETRRNLHEILDGQQVQRLEQIRIRIRGYRSLLDSQVAKQLRLDNTQRHQIERVLETLKENLAKLQQRAQAGEPRDSLAERATEQQRDAQKQVLAILQNDQRRQFVALIGRTFDVQQLSRVRFQAPEFAATDAWLNSPPLELRRLRGKVVALHFWTYG